MSDYYTTPERSPGPPDDGGASHWYDLVADEFGHLTDGECLEDALPDVDVFDHAPGAPANVAEYLAEMWEERQRAQRILDGEEEGDD